MTRDDDLTKILTICIAHPDFVLYSVSKMCCYRPTYVPRLIQLLAGSLVLCHQRRQSNRRSWKADLDRVV